MAWSHRKEVWGRLDQVKEEPDQKALGLDEPIGKRLVSIAQKPNEVSPPFFRLRNDVNPAGINHNWQLQMGFRKLKIKTILKLSEFGKMSEIEGFRGLPTSWPTLFASISDGETLIMVKNLKKSNRFTCSGTKLKSPKIVRTVCNFLKI